MEACNFHFVSEGKQTKCDLQNANVIPWIMKFLTKLPQRATIKDARSTSLTLNVGGPQGRMLSAQLFTLYASECKTTTSACKMLKYVDDMNIVGLMRNDTENDTQVYFDKIVNFHNWRNENFLNLNIEKIGRTYY